MVRLIAFIIIFALFLAFIGLNLDNKCDISLGFRTFQDVPVFISVLSSFVVGMLFTIPIVFSMSRKRKKSSPPQIADHPPAHDAKPGKKLFGFFGKKKAGKAGFDAAEAVHMDDPAKRPEPIDQINREKSPYGID